MGLLGNPYLQGLLAGPEAIRQAQAQQRQALLPPARGSLIPAPDPIRGPPDNVGSGLKDLGQGLADIADAKKAADARNSTKMNATEPEPSPVEPADSEQNDLPKIVPVRRAMRLGNRTILVPVLSYA